LSTLSPIHKRLLSMQNHTDSTDIGLGTFNYSITITIIINKKNNK